MAKQPSKNPLAIEPEAKRRWVRNGELAKYLGVSKMTLWRFKRDPSYGFPPASKVNDLEWNDLAAVDAWMEARVVKHQS
jgi:predicted DNA-binding transcriptional regulator AlpA